MHNYEDLDVWQVSYALALDLYRDTAKFPRSELYGMVSQIRRSGTSVPANIAEGCRRLTPGELRHFLGIASGSSGELDVFLRFSIDLGFMPPEIGAARRTTNTRVAQMLRGLIHSIHPGSWTRKARTNPPIEDAGT